MTTNVIVNSKQSLADVTNVIVEDKEYIVSVTSGKMYRFKDDTKGKYDGKAMTNVLFNISESCEKSYLKKDEVSEHYGIESNAVSSALTDMLNAFEDIKGNTLISSFRVGYPVGKNDEGDISPLALFDFNRAREAYASLSGNQKEKDAFIASLNPFFKAYLSLGKFMEKGKDLVRIDSTNDNEKYGCTTVRYAIKGKILQQLLKGVNPSEKLHLHAEININESKVQDGVNMLSYYKDSYHNIRYALGVGRSREYELPTFVSSETEDNLPF